MIQSVSSAQPIVRITLRYIAFIIWKRNSQYTLIKYIKLIFLLAKYVDVVTHLAGKYVNTI